MQAFNLKLRIKSLFQRRTVTERILYTFVFVVFAAFTAFYLYILLWAFVAGCKSNSEIANDPFGFPSVWHLGNYLEIFSYFEVNGVGFFGMLFNSLFFSILGPLINLFFTCLFAYVCCKYKFIGSKLVFPIILIFLTLPIYGSSGSLYKTLAKLSLIDTYAHIILAFGGFNTFCLYFKAVFDGVSDSYAEAAMIDGANDFQVYFEVMFPQAKNLFLSLFIMSWVAEWNNYASVLLYLPNLPTLAAGVYMCETDMIYAVRYDMLYAAYFASSIPPIILYALFNDVLTSSVSLGGIKE